MSHSHPVETLPEALESFLGTEVTTSWDVMMFHHHLLSEASWQYHQPSASDSIYRLPTALQDTIVEAQKVPLCPIMFGRWAGH